MKAERVVIRKYGNRRLYDTSSSRYVNLEELAGMVRNGKDVQVVEARGGADVTRATLTQIIAESSREEGSGLPLELLRQLVIASDHAGREFILWYLKSAFDTYHKLQATIEGGWGGVQEAAFSPLSMVRRFMQGAVPGEVSGRSEVERLRRRVAQLEAQVKAQPEAVKATQPTASAKSRATKKRVARKG